MLICSAVAVAGTTELIPLDGDLLVQTHASSGSDDAGSGGDASDSKATPTRLADPGEYTGQVASEDDIDWFGLGPGSTDVCVETSASGSAQTQVTLDMPGLATVKADTHKGKDKTVDLALAGSSVSDIHFGFTKSNDASRAAGDYSFELATFSAADLLADGDAGSGTDAGDTIATASAIGEGCAGGTLASSDTADVYAIEADAGDVATLSLAQVSGDGTLVLELLDGSGTSLMTLQDDEAGSYTFDAAGTYYLEVHDTGDDTSQARAMGLPDGLETLSDDDDDYLLSVDGPEPPSCSPTC